MEECLVVDKIKLNIGLSSLLICEIEVRLQLHPNLSDSLNYLLVY